MEEQVKTLERKLIAREQDIDDWVQLVRTIRKHFVKETEYYENLVYELEMKLAKKDRENLELRSTCGSGIIGKKQLAWEREKLRLEFEAGGHA